MASFRRLLFCKRGKHRIAKTRVKHDGQTWVGPYRDCGTKMAKSMRTGAWHAVQNHKADGP